MRNLKVLSALVLSIAALGANAEGVADQHSEADFTAKAVANYYSGNQTVLRGQVVNRDEANQEVVASPYSGNQVVLRGQVVTEDQGA